jgi:hypothetical protein
VGGDSAAHVDKSPEVLRHVNAAEWAVRMLLRHAGCHCRASVADVEVAPSGEVFMTHGWGKIARACCPWGASAIHLELDGASSLRFKVFNEDGQRLECCPGTGNPRDVAPGGELALGPISDSPRSSSSRSQESGDSPETSDDSYVPPSFRRARSWASAPTRRRR